MLRLSQELSTLWTGREESVQAVSVSKIIPDCRVGLHKLCADKTRRLNRKRDDDL